MAACIMAASYKQYADAVAFPFSMAILVAANLKL